MGYHRSKERNRRLKKLYDETKTWYGAGVYYDEDNDRFIKYYRSKRGYTKYLRRVANRKVRRSKDCLKHGSYRKVYDYWLELF